MKVKEESEKAGLKLNIKKIKIMAFGTTTSCQIDEEPWKQWQSLFLGLQNPCRWWLQPWNLKMLDPWKKRRDKPRQSIKKQRHHFVDKRPYGQS